MARKESRKVAQAWIELVSTDPEAYSALEIARSQLAAGKRLTRMRRLRVVELEGKLPARERLEALLHGSTQFYNPHKERCTVRLASDEPAPLRPGERAVLVFERGGARRGAAERWWLHETGEPVNVREGTAWAVSFEEGVEGEALEDLTLVRGRRHGLLCNPHSQEYRLAAADVPLPWIDADDGVVLEAKPARRKPAGPARSKR